MQKILIIISLLIFISPVFALGSDFDNDGKVDLGDFFNFAEGFRQFDEEGVYDVKFDLDKNKKIDVEDFFIFAEEFGKKIIITKPSSKKLVVSLDAKGQLYYEESEKRFSILC